MEGAREEGLLGFLRPGTPVVAALILLTRCRTDAAQLMAGTQEIYCIRTCTFCAWENDFPFCPGSTWATTENSRMPVLRWKLGTFLVRGLLWPRVKIFGAAF